MAINAYPFVALPGAKDKPLVFAFHGTGGDEHQLVSLAREVSPKSAIVSPRGDVSEGGAARFFRRTSEGVYDMADLARAADKMAGFVASHVKDIKPTAVAALGYSNGANILAATLFDKPKLFDAAALMHPLIPFEPNIKGSLKGKPILITAGKRDPICPPELTSRLESYLKAAGAKVTLNWHGGGHELRDEEIEAAREFLADIKGEKRTMSETIKREDGPTKGRYVIKAPSGEEAEMTYSKLGDTAIIIDHTGVPDVFRGQGVGLKLVTRAVEDARKAGIKIIPLCPFAKAQFDRHKDWADVLKG